VGLTSVATTVAAMKPPPPPPPPNTHTPRAQARTDKLWFATRNRELILRWRIEVVAHECQVELA
jgi:hypothetical protein